MSDSSDILVTSVVLDMSDTSKKDTGLIIIGVSFVIVVGYFSEIYKQKSRVLLLVLIL